MVIPWIGFQLSGLLDRVGVQAGAKYVAFETVVRPEQMPGQGSRFIDWPYREGLRLDEAMNPLTILATGLYGEAMPRQNGAPLRLVVPWIGFPLSGLLERIGVKPGAKFVAFETLVRPEEMPGQAYPILEWPYREGLTLAEAMHPLTILATGLYDKPMPNQNGAPIRLVVPWKYGFKSIKSVVRITLTDRQPETSWQALQPSEYGFYANVNPQVDHPRWSQASERRIGAGLLAGRQETLMFNGYGDQVSGLYSGLDLAKNY